MRRINSEALNNQITAEASRKKVLKDFIAEKEGEKAEKFLKRMQLVQDWLIKNKVFFTEYKLAEKEFESFATIEKRKPESDFITTLSLDVTPKIGESIARFRKAKKEYYNAIRSADAHTKHHSKNRLMLDLHERRKLIGQINTICANANIPTADFNTLLFPDSTFSVTEEEIKDPHKKINFPFMETFFATGEIITLIDSKLRSRNHTKPKGNG